MFRRATICSLVALFFAASAQAKIPLQGHLESAELDSGLLGNATANPEFVKQLDALGLVPASGTPKELGEMIRTELARWTKVIRDAGIQAN